MLAVARALGLQTSLATHALLLGLVASQPPPDGGPPNGAVDQPAFCCTDSRSCMPGFFCSKDGCAGDRGSTSTCGLSSQICQPCQDCQEAWDVWPFGMSCTDACAASQVSQSQMPPRLSSISSARYAVQC